MRSAKGEYPESKLSMFYKDGFWWVHEEQWTPRNTVCGSKGWTRCLLYPLSHNSCFIRSLACTDSVGASEPPAHPEAMTKPELMVSTRPMILGAGHKEACWVSDFLGVNLPADGCSCMSPHGSVGSTSSLLPCQLKNGPRNFPSALSSEKTVKYKDTGSGWYLGRPRKTKFKAYFLGQWD